MDQTPRQFSGDGPPSPPPAPASSAESSRVHWRSLRILVADDDPDTVKTLCVILEDEGHKVRGVCNAPDVLPAVQSFQPEAVIVDIAMPKMNGYEVAKEIRQRFTTYRPLLIAISGLLDKERDGLYSKRAGFDHHLAKPCNPDELLFLLAPVMRQRR